MQRPADGAQATGCRPQNTAVCCCRRRRARRVVLDALLAGGHRAAATARLVTGQPRLRSLGTALVDFGPAASPPGRGFHVTAPPHRRTRSFASSVAERWARCPARDTSLCRLVALNLPRSFPTDADTEDSGPTAGARARGARAGTLSPPRHYLSDVVETSPEEDRFYSVWSTSRARPRRAHAGARR